MYEYNARLLRNINGNAATLMVDLGFNVYTQISVQVKGIRILESTNTLEERRATKAAENYLEVLLAQSPLTIKTETSGTPGRYFVSVINGAGVDVGAEMVKAGHAFPLSAEHARD